MGIKEELSKIATTCVFPKSGYDALMRRIATECALGNLEPNECDNFAETLRLAAVECSLNGSHNEVPSFKNELDKLTPGEIESFIGNVARQPLHDHNIPGLRQCLIDDNAQVEAYAILARELLYGQQYDLLPPFIEASISADLYSHFMNAVGMSQYTSYANLVFDGVAVGTSDAAKSLMAAAFLGGHTGLQGKHLIQTLVIKLVGSSPMVYKSYRFIRLIPLLLVLYSITQFFDVVRAILLSYELPDANYVFSQASYRLRVLKNCGYLTDDEYKLCTEQVNRIAHDLIHRYDLPTSGSMIQEVSKAALPSIFYDSIDDALDSYFNDRLPSNFVSYVLCSLISFAAGYATSSAVSKK